MKTLKELNLLYIEDDNTIRENYAFVFKDTFFNYYETSSYEEALSIYEKYHIDIMIVDIELNGSKNGIDIIKTIRKQDINTKIIVTSAYSSTENLLEASSLMLTRFLVKPVNPKELYDCLNKALEEINTIRITKQDSIKLNENLYWNFISKELIKNNKTINLTKKEKEILNYIFSNPSIELTYENIIDEIWDYDCQEHMETLRTLVSNIRKHLPKNTIKTLYNIGYRFNTI